MLGFKKNKKKQATLVATSQEAKLLAHEQILNQIQKIEGSMSLDYKTKTRHLDKLNRWKRQLEDDVLNYMSDGSYIGEGSPDDVA